MGDTAAALVIALSADLKAFRKEMRDAVGINDKASRDIERRQSAMRRKMEGMFSGFGRSLMAPLAGIGAMLGTREILKYAESWAEAENRLRMIGFSGGAAKDALEQIYQAAQGSDQKLGPMVEVFAKLAQAGKGLGITSAEYAKLTEAVGLGAKVSGVDVGNTSAVDQIMVAMQTGKFNAKGVRGMFGEMPALAKAAAEGVKEAGGSVQKLFDLVSKGKVSPTQFARGIIAAIESLRAAAAREIEPVSDAMTHLDNALGRYIGTAASGMNASHALAGGIDYLAEHLQDAVNAATVLAAALAGAGAGSLIQSIGKVGTAFGVLSTFISKNPWVFALTVIGTLAAAMIVYANSSRTVADALKDEKKAQDDLNAILDEAKKNGNTITADKLAEAGARHYNARMALEEAIALAKVAEQKAQGKLSLGESIAAGVINSPGTPGIGMPMPTKSPYQQLAEKQAEEARANVKKAQDDLSSLDKRWAAAKLKVEKPGPVYTPPDTKAEALAQRRAEFLARVTAGAESANADLVKASKEAEAEMLRGADGYYAALRAKIDADADAEITAVRAKRDSDLLSIKDMKDGWAEYGAAVDKINQEADARVGAINAKRGADLGSAGSELQERTKELQDHIATLGMTSEAADRYLLTQVTEAKAAALEAGDHHEAAVALRDKLAAYLEWSEGAEKADTATARVVSEADALRDAFAGLAHGDPLKQILDRLIQIALEMEVIEPLTEGLFGKRGTTLGGVVGGGSGGGGGLLSSALRWGKDLLGFAGGTNSAPGGLSLVGERGPEILNLPKGSQVIPAAQSLAALRGGGGNSMSYTNMGGNIVVMGDTDSKSLRLMKSMLDQKDAEFESRWMAAHQKYGRTK
jgi:hypothetical protein